MERKIKKGMISAVIVVIVVVVMVFNQSTRHYGGEARIIISLNYGKVVMLDRIIPAGESVLDALKSVANVTTSYGGGFVSGINGIMCDENRKIDWFYYINGILANVGSSQYIIRDGDVVRWDYHHWENDMLINAEIEDFPEPLLRGYAGKTYPTVITYEKGYMDIASILYSYLKKSIMVEMKSIDNLSDEEKQQDNLIVIGMNSTLIGKINSMHEKLGFFYYLDGGVVRDINGTAYRGGFAEITQSPYNPKGTWACENVLILISGNSHTFIKNCVENLISGEISKFWCFAGEKI